MSRNFVMVSKKNISFVGRLAAGAGLTGNAVAKAIGVGRQTYYYWLKPGTSINFAHLVRLKRFFGLTWAQLGELIDEDLAAKEANKKRLKAGKTAKDRARIH
jgi:transcriptional regulator with XRE-family HTH domain